MATAARGQIIHRLVGHRPLVALPDGLILARGADLFHWTRGGQPPRWVAGLELEPFEARTMAPRLLQRLTRSGPQCGAVAGPGRLVVASKRALFEVDLVRHASRRMECAARGRPLNLVSIEGVPGFADQVCFGEYLGNPGCAPVSIWSDGGEGRFREVFKFAHGEIEHVHTLVPDPGRGAVWILAGDFEQAASIWLARDDFGTVEPVVRGQQRFRAAAAFVVDDGLLYGTDSQFEGNSVRLLRHHGGEWVSEEIAPLAGSCIHSCRVGEQMCFSTTVEPRGGSGFRPLDLLDPRLGPAIERRWSDLLCGDLSRGFERIGSWPKDIWPMGLCGFGTIAFPSGQQPAGTLAAYGAGLRGIDGAALLIKV